MSTLDRGKVRQGFEAAVNMGAVEIEDWLETEQSRAVGWKGPDARAGESIGHASGRRIVAILRKNRTELTTADYEHMRKVVGFIRRHSAQRPVNIYTSRWRYSLMNWGHDPGREETSAIPRFAEPPRGTSQAVRRLRKARPAARDMAGR
ncbi:MAG: DUF3140 domain-containing protein [Sphingomicrobium sp.]